MKLLTTIPLLCPLQLKVANLRDRVLTRIAYGYSCCLRLLKLI
jgi:hypothetical protein